MAKAAAEVPEVVERFVREVVATEIVWGIRMTNGFANWGSPETEPWSVMPFWSTEKAAAKCAVELAEQFNKGKPASIPLFDFLYRWLPNMVKDFFMPGVNCTPDGVGPAVRASLLQECIHQELARLGRLAAYQDRLKHEKARTARMTPQAILKARFSELAEAHDVVLVSRRQGGKFYFNLTGDWKAQDRFRAASIPGMWMTSSGGDVTYGLPLDEAEKIIAAFTIDPAWLQHNDSAALRLAQEIRDKESFDVLPILADALEEAGCANAEILTHCRAPGKHKHCCWVVELLLGPDRKRRRTPQSV